MSDDQNNTNSKGPSYNAYHVEKGKNDKSYFTKIGAAFKHKDGQGYTIPLKAMPVDGVVTLRSPKEKLDDMKNGSGQEKPAQDKGHDR